MGAVDGMPMVNYGQLEAINPLTTLYVVLYPVPDYIGDQEFLYEDDVTRSLFLHRISGDIQMAWETPEDVASASYGGWSLMPLGVEYDTVSVLQPFTIPWDPLLPEWCNLSHWAKRYYRPTLGAAFNGLPPDPFAHPWWTYVDVKPKRKLGVDNNLWPVLAVRNSDAMSRLYVRHTLKAWYG